jgi:murein L,D-transpeptidase YafK
LIVFKNKLPSAVMNLRFLAGIFIIASAVVVAPWVVGDWLNHDYDQGEEADSGFVVTVPAMAEKAPEKRRVIELKPLPTPQGEPQPDMTAVSRRSIPKGAATSFKTSALALLRGERSEKVPGNEAARQVVNLHAGRISQEMSRLGLSLGLPVYMRIFKEEKELELWVQKPGELEFILFKIYRIIHAPAGIGPKVRTGDGRGAEGFYYVSGSRLRAETRSQLGFDLGHPNLADRYHQRSGSALVQGERLGDGSYSLSNPAIEEIYTIAAAALDEGQSFFRVHSFPFRMDDKRMGSKIAQHPDQDAFWANLKEGYDFFEVLRFPPNVTVLKDGSYEFMVTN